MTASASPTSVAATPGRPPALQPLPTRNCHGNRYVYTVLSQRAGGLSIGINLNPDGRSNFDCFYCEIDRSHPGGPHGVNVPAMLVELERMLELVQKEEMGLAGFAGMPAELRVLKEVALSGDGEPTLCPNFCAVLEAIAALRTRRSGPRFKIVVITNTIGLGFPKVRAAIALLSPEDEVWAKLDAGSQAYMNAVNRPGISIEMVLRGIRELDRIRHVVIQSLFPLIDGQEPSDEEISIYARNLLELKQGGARISLVQIYSAHRPAVDTKCGHLPLKTLSKIAHAVREVTGLKAEVF